MNNIPVFAAERDAGLTEAVQASASASYLTKARISQKPGTSFDLGRVRLHDLMKTQATNLHQEDLHYLDSILATTGWNKNDDVFIPYETWLARATPEDKPFNYEHDCSDIIGHITDVGAIDDELQTIANNTVLDDLPSKFHLVTNSVLYKHWAKEELQSRMDTILAEIAQGDEWYISMEALFRGFDYALLKSDGTQKIVARNQDTAFLTKHLRAYGGTGEFNDAQIGRVMRNIVFCGKGLVRKPANPESIIFATKANFSENNSTNSIEKTVQKTEMGYEVNDGQKFAEQKMERERAMSSENTQAQVTELQNKLNAALAKLDAIDQEKVEAQINAANKERDEALQNLAKAEKDFAELTEANKQLTTEAEQSKADLAKVTEERNSLKAEFDKISAEKIFAGRIAIVKEKLEIDGEAAKAFVEGLAAFDDEAFVRHIEATMAIKPQPTQTSADAPMAGGGKKVATIGQPGGAVPQPSVNNNPATASEPVVEKDKADAGADTSVLDDATANKEPVMATEAETKAERTRADIAKFFSKDEEETDEK